MRWDVNKKAEGVYSKLKIINFGSRGEGGVGLGYEVWRKVDEGRNSKIGEVG